MSILEQINSKLREAKTLNNFEQQRIVLELMSKLMFCGYSPEQAKQLIKQALRN